MSNKKRSKKTSRGYATKSDYEVTNGPNMNVNTETFLVGEKIPSAAISKTTATASALNNDPIPNVIGNLYAQLNTINISQQKRENSPVNDHQNNYQQNVQMAPNCSLVSLTSQFSPLPSASSLLTTGNIASTSETSSKRINENNSGKTGYRYVKPQISWSATEVERSDVVDKATDRQPLYFHHLLLNAYVQRLRMQTISNLEQNENLLVFQGDTLISGNLDSLIQHMVPTNTYYPERNFMFAFLLSARLFIRPHELLARISQTWESQNNIQHQQNAAIYAIKQLSSSGGNMMTVSSLNNNEDTFTAVNQKQKSTILSLNKQKEQHLITQISAQRCIRLLAEWIEMFPYDFRDECLMQQVRILTRKCVYIDNTLGKQVSCMLQQLVQRLTALEMYEDRLQMLLQQQNDLCDNPMAGLNSFYGSSIPAPISSSIKTSLSNAVSSSINSNESKNIFNQTHSSDLNVLSKINISQSLNHCTDLPYQKNAKTTATLPTPLPTTSSATRTAATLSSSTNGFNTCELYGIMSVCPSCLQLAHQLTAIELERLSHIGPEEFVQAFAKEYQTNPINHTKEKTESVQGSTQTACDLSVSATASSGGSHNCSTASSNESQTSSRWRKDVKKTRNLEVYIEWFNRLSYLIATEIVKCAKRKHRVRIIEYWIETARECFNIGNFNSLMAIIAGLNLAPISRLKKTWSKVHSAKFAVLEHQMDPTANFNSYRATLKAAMWRSEGATEERERIIIPLFSLFVKDIYFLNESCSNRLPNNHINFEKWSQLAKQIMEFNEWKKVKCPFEVSQPIVNYLQSSSVFNENTLTMASFACEQPESTEEKCRYKAVKAESKQRQTN